MKLLPFQVKGVQSIHRFKGRCLLADEMGLGKTVQAIQWLRETPEAFPAVVVCPSYLKENWKREFKTWFPQCVTQILSGTRAYDLNHNAHVYIINYDILRPIITKVKRKKSVNKHAWPLTLLAEEVQAVILDECHYVKSQKALRSKGTEDLCKGRRYVIGLSGTPIENRPFEFWNILRIINKAIFPNYFVYTRRYCGAHFNGFGWEFKGATHKDELHEILTKTIMIRRLKRDVMSDLGEKVRRVFIAGDADSLFMAETQRALEDMKHKKGLAVKDTYMKLLHKAGLLKVNSVSEWILDAVESGENPVVFTHHIDTVSAIVSRLRENGISVGVNTGKENDTARQKAVDDFQAGKIQAIIGTVGAMGTGVTLTRASHVMFAELPFSPGVVDQAEDRLHRKGQEKTVFVWYAVLSGSIDDEVVTMLDEKRKVLTKVVNGEKVNKDILLKTIIGRKTHD